MTAPMQRLGKDDERGVLRPRLVHPRGQFSHGPIEIEGNRRILNDRDRRAPAMAIRSASTETGNVPRRFFTGICSAPTPGRIEPPLDERRELLGDEDVAARK